MTLRFQGREEDGSTLHELRAAHVAEVLQGLVGISSDFAKAGAFGDGPVGSEVLVRPAEQGSFYMEVVRHVWDHKDDIGVAATYIGGPTLGQVLWWATKSARASVKDFDYLDNGKVKVVWQDDTVDEVPRAAWDELNKRKRRRKKQLRQIMAPLSDGRVSEVEIEQPHSPEPEAPEAPPERFVLRRPDYDAVRPDDEVEERADVFGVEAQMSAIDFDNPAKWRVKTKDVTRSAVVEDEAFLGRVAGGMAIRKTDIFFLRVREDTVKKNGKTRRKWTVLKVESHRRAVHDDDD